MAKFEIGEVAIVRSVHSSITAECVIIGIGGIADYVILVPELPSYFPDGSWSCFEYQLRKKRPSEGREWFYKTIKIKQPERV